MSNQIQDSFKTVFIILQHLGLYPEKTKISKFRAYVLYFFGLSLPFLVLINFLQDENLSTLRINQMMSFLPETLSCYLKLIPFLRKSFKIKNCVEFFGRKRFAPKNEEEKKILDECVGVCRRNVNIYLPGLLFGAAAWSILPFFSKEHRLPVDIWLPFGLLLKSGIFYIANVYISAGIIYLSLAGEMLEPLLGGLIYHATAQMKILKHNLENLEKPILKNLSCCIVHHNLILKFIDEFEKCFSWCIFWQMAGSFFGTVFYCVGLNTVNFTSVDGVMFLSSYFVTTFQIFFYCHYGSLLFEENEGLRTAIYKSLWYEYDVRTRKMLLVIMERSKKPLLLTAGKLINLTYTTLTSLLKTSYSLVAVMSSFTQV